MPRPRELTASHWSASSSAQQPEMDLDSEPYGQQVVACSDAAVSPGACAICQNTNRPAVKIMGTRGGSGGTALPSPLPSDTALSRPGTSSSPRRGGWPAGLESAARLPAYLPSPAPAGLLPQAQPSKSVFLNVDSGTSLVVQWLRLCASTVGDTGSIRGQGTKMLHAMWHGQNRK